MVKPNCVCEEAITFIFNQTTPVYIRIIHQHDFCWTIIQNLSQAKLIWNLSNKNYISFRQGWGFETVSFSQKIFLLKKSFIWFDPVGPEWPQGSGFPVFICIVMPPYPLLQLTGSFVMQWWVLLLKYTRTLDPFGLFPWCFPNIPLKLGFHWRRLKTPVYQSSLE